MTPDDLVQFELIKRVKYRYLRCLDQKLWAELETCLTPDAVAAYSGGKYTFHGRDEILTFLRRTMGAESFHSSHRVHHPEIDIDGDRAHAVFAMEDTVVMTDWDLTIHGAAFYEDVFALTDEGWKIASTGYRRSFEEIYPRSSIPGLRLTASWWATDGRSDLEA